MSEYSVQRCFDINEEMLSFCLDKESKERFHRREDADTGALKVQGTLSHTLL